MERRRGGSCVDARLRLGVVYGCVALNEGYGLGEIRNDWERSVERRRGGSCVDARLRLGVVCGCVALNEGYGLGEIRNDWERSVERRRGGSCVDARLRLGVVCGCVALNEGYGEAIYTFALRTYKSGGICVFILSRLRRSRFESLAPSQRFQETEREGFEPPGPLRDRWFSRPEP